MDAKVCAVAVGICAALIAASAPSSGAAVAAFTESFERGTVGSQPTAANTAYDQSIGDRGDGDGTIHVKFASAGWRGHCAQFANYQPTPHRRGTRRSGIAREVRQHLVGLFWGFSPPPSRVVGERVENVIVRPQTLGVGC